jgi:membrane complex biogenesis BtpA family protein
MTEGGPAVARARETPLTAIFGRSSRVLIGVVHLLPLPASPDYSGGGVKAIYARALGDARAYADADFHGLVVENHGDIPFSKPEDIGPETGAHMAIATDRLRTATGLPVGINVLANAALQALAIASAASAHFVRVNQWANAYVANEGLIEGAAAKAMRYRSALQARGVSIFADAHVKHGARHRSGPADRRTRSRRRVFQRRRRDLHGPAHGPCRRFRLSPENRGGRFASDACLERG